MPDNALQQMASVRRIGTVLLAVLACTAFLATPAMASEHVQLTENQVTVEQSAETTIPLNVSEGESTAIEFVGQDAPVRAEATVTDDGDGTVELVVDTDSADSAETLFSANNGTVSDATIEKRPDGNALPVGEYLLTAGEDGTETAAVVVYPVVELDGGNVLTLDGAPEQTISGTAKLDEGETIDVRIKSAGENPFLVSEAANVSENGQFEVTVDLSNVDVETVADLTLRYDGTTVGVGSVEVSPFETHESDERDDDKRVAINVESLELTAAESQVIHGQSDLPAGEDVAVSLSSTGQNPFRLTNRTVTEEDGEFKTTVDLSHVPANTSFTLSVRHGGEQIGSTTGVINVTNQQQRGDKSDNAESNDLQDALTLAYEGEQMELENAGNRTIAGAGDITANHTVRIRLRGSGETPFLLTEQAEVDRHGNYKAIVNMDELDVPPGTEFDINVVAYGEDERLQTTGTGVVVESEDDNDGTGAESNNPDIAGAESPLSESTVAGAGLIGLAGVLALVGIALLVRAGRIPGPN